ncbi:MAG TPA: hypothetical protein VFS00_20120 [Polyangiaceae bacterium]|nr:hypothetical protein [Polyangiaceae bacterium]
MGKARAAAGAVPPKVGMKGRAGAAAKGAVGKGAVAKGAAGKGTVGKGAVAKGAVGKGAVGKGAAGKSAVGNGAVGKGAAGKGAVGKGGAAGQRVAEKLDWEIEFARRGGEPTRAKLSELERLYARVFFAVRGELPATRPFLYLLQLEEENRALRVALFGRVSELGRPGETVCLPREGAFLFAHSAGPVHVWASERELTLKELADLLRGREPAPQGVDRNST